MILPALLWTFGVLVVASRSERIRGSQSLSEISKNIDLSVVLVAHLHRYFDCLGGNLRNVSALQGWYQSAKTRESIGGERKLSSSTLFGLVWTLHVYFLQYVIKRYSVTDIK